MHTLVLGTPSTTMLHEAQRPMAQKNPRGLSSFLEWRKTLIPLAIRADEIISPSNPSNSLPSKVNLTSMAREDQTHLAMKKFAHS